MTHKKTEKEPIIEDVIRTRKLEIYGSGPNPRITIKGNDQRLIEIRHQNSRYIVAKLEDDIFGNLIFRLYGKNMGLLFRLTVEPDGTIWGISDTIPSRDGGKQIIFAEPPKEDNSNAE